MTRHTTTELEQLVREALDAIAPDVDASTADARADFHDDLGLDSMDTLNFAIEVESLTGVGIPEQDYPRISSISACVTYLAARSGS